ncbi:ATP-dependent DNA helicase PIF1 [Trifolium repens]|nr:ATP-dependent DNA helicase PIF1 [Trifolium repens]
MKNTPVCTMIKDITKNLTVFSKECVLLDSQDDKIQSTINFPEAAALKLITSENNDSHKQLLTLTTNNHLIGNTLQDDKIQSTINFPEAVALKLITSKNNDSPKQLLTLTTNIRLGASSNSTNPNDIKEFADWVLSIGDGNSSADESADIEINIPKELLIQDCADPLQALIDFAYPDLLQNTNTSHYFQDRTGIGLAGSVK